MTNELKPCPFCGSENAAAYSVKSCHSVLCVACGGEGPEADSEEGAIAAWNRRATAGVAVPPAPGKRWPFVESPGEFTERLAEAMRQFPTLLAAVRYVLIEQPPTFAPGVKASDEGKG